MDQPGRVPSRSFAPQLTGYIKDLTGVWIVPSTFQAACWWLE